MAGDATFLGQGPTTRRILSRGGDGTAFAIIMADDERGNGAREIKRTPAATDGPESPAATGDV